MSKLLLNIKRNIKFIISKLVDFFIYNSSSIKSRTLLLIRLDAIGDYILFRNFIKEIKYSKKYKGYSITLVGNISWKSLADELDREYIDNFIWLDRGRFSKNPFYRYKKLKEITSKGYEVIINPTYSRNFLDCDNIVKLVNADEKIAMDGDISNSTLKQHLIGNTFYTKLISTDDNIMFEFYRNRAFFESLLFKNIEITKPSIELERKEFDFIPKDRYVVIFIGGSSYLKKWDIKRYASIAKYLKYRYNYIVVLSGSSDDVEQSKNFREYFDNDYVDLVSKTSLVDMLYLLSKADILVSNETSIPHIAVALNNIKVFVLYAGKHFGRFVPYPKEIITKYCLIYIENNFDINLITIDMVKKEIDKVLDEK